MPPGWPEAEGRGCPPGVLGGAGFPALCVNPDGARGSAAVVGRGYPPGVALAPSGAILRPLPPSSVPAPSRLPGRPSGPQGVFCAAIARPLARWLAGIRRPGGDGIASGFAQAGSSLGALFLSFTLFYF